MKLSVVVLTNRSRELISPTLNSVAFADEVLVLDLRKKSVSDFSHERNLGLAKAKGDWVLFVDDDEIVTPSLAAEIKAATGHPKYTGYCLKRLDRYFGQTLHHGETGNIGIIRLAKKNAGKFTRPVHEIWKVSGLVGELINPLIHSRGQLVEPFINRIAFYGPLDATALDSEGKPFSYFRLLINPLAKFIFNYKIKLGILDGYLGLFQAYLMSIQSLSVRVFQWQKRS